MIDFTKLRDLIVEKKCISSNDYGKEDPFIGIYWKDLIDIINQCDSKKWISVEEALPKDFEKVFFRAVGKNDAVCFGTGYVVKEDWYTDIQRGEQYYFKFEITHWMHIPSLEGGEK